MKFRNILLSVGLLCMASGVRAADSLRVYLIGDSTCATKKLDKQNPERGWGHMFQPLFDETVVIENHAVNGRSTKSFRDEGRWDRVCDGLRSGDYVFIQFGHNDQKINDSTRYSAPERYAENLRRYVREARAKGARPVLLTPIVRRNFVDGVLTDTHGEYPAAVRRVAAEEQVPLIDMEPLTREWVAALGDETSKACFMWVAPGVCPLYPDGRQDDTHLNVRGAHVVARMVGERLREQIPELGRHFRDYDFIVAKDGSGDFFTVGEAIAAIPDYCGATTRIAICEGLYREKVAIPATKRNVVLEGRGEVVISWGDYASKIGATGHPTGTSGSSTVYFGGDHWQIRDLTFENTAGRVGQAVAVQCLGTDLHFFGCRFLGDQDTLYLHGRGNCDGRKVPENSVCFFEKCYVEGTTDFIFGAAAALFRDCEIRSKADSYITAASTCEGQPAGFIFINCLLTADDGVEACYLGRPWRDYAQTYFFGCTLGEHIRPAGWHDWNKPRAHKTARYGEFDSRGPGAAASERVKWSRQLSAKEASRVLDTFEACAALR
ncbi:MAG: pectinesterase family protein [Alistipes senegalensis]|nr:pectinesterase family protein [Alistipes senegalensis]